MIEIFLQLLPALLTMFLCMAIGYILRKTNRIGDEASKVIAKLETNVFCIALSFSTMARRFTVENLKRSSTDILFGLLVVGISIFLAIALSKLFVKEDNYDRRIYRYALAFGNYGYVGDPIVASLFEGGFNSDGFFFYKMVTVPASILCLAWGVSGLITTGRTTKDKIKSIFTPQMMGQLVGMVVGITGLGNVIFNTTSCAFLADTLDKLSACMGPCAMLLAGITVARFSVGRMLKDKKVYIATLFRLVILPAVILVITFGVKVLINLVFGVNLNNNFMYFAFFILATPFGMNTIVYPESYGLDASTGAAMTLISHTICVITIPVLFAVFCQIFGGVPVF